MDIKTGKIYEGDALSEEQKRNPNMMQLSREEAEFLKRIPEKDRPRELAVKEFVRQRKELKAPHGIDVQNAFRIGFESAKELYLGQTKVPV